MGNIFDAEATHRHSEDEAFIHNHLLMPAEIASIRKVFEDAVNESKKNGNGVPEGILPFRNFPNLTKALVEGRHFSDWKKTADFVGNCIRLSKSRGVDLIWRTLASIYPEEQVADHFLQLMFDLSVNEESDEDSRAIFSKRLREFIIATMAKRDSLSISTGESANTTSEAQSETRKITLDQLRFWMNEYAPRFLSALETSFTIKYLKHMSPSFQPFVAPILLDTSSIISTGDVLPLAYYNQSLQGEWVRLYTSDVDGRSFNRLVHSVLGYDGPTCLFVKSHLAPGSIFGGYSGDKWRESNRHSGTTSDFVFSLSPNIRIYRPQNGSNGCFKWLNVKSYGMPHGLGFGGNSDHDKFRLFISDAFEDCVINSECLTFEPGPLARVVQPPKKETKSTLFGDSLAVDDMERSPASQASLEIDYIEVWGCGGQDRIRAALSARDGARKTANDVLTKARKCDKAAFFNNSFDQEFLLSKTFQHRKQVQDREES